MTPLNVNRMDRTRRPFLFASLMVLIVAAPGANASAMPLSQTQSAVVVDAGSSYALPFAEEMEGAISWGSSNPAVASVDQFGRVYGLSNGNAAITAICNGVSYTECVLVNGNIHNVINLDEFQSDHPYADSSNDIWVFHSIGAGALRLTFDERTCVEEGVDRIEIVDASGDAVAEFTGNALAGKSIVLECDTVGVRLVSDGEGGDWGFAVTEVDVISADIDSDDRSCDVEKGGCLPPATATWEGGGADPTQELVESPSTVNTTVLESGEDAGGPNSSESGVAAHEYGGDSSGHDERGSSVGNDPSDTENPKGADVTWDDATANALRESLLKVARECLGVPYFWGGTDMSGFDSSGLAQYCYERCGYSIPRDTYGQIAEIEMMGNWHASIDELKPGDLLFPHEEHVAIYCGDGLMIHAPYPGRDVCCENVADTYGKILGGGSPVIIDADTRTGSQPDQGTAEITGGSVSSENEGERGSSGQELIATPNAVDGAPDRDAPATEVMSDPGRGVESSSADDGAVRASRRDMADTNDVASAPIGSDGAPTEQTTDASLAIGDDGSVVPVEQSLDTEVETTPRV